LVYGVGDGWECFDDPAVVPVVLKICSVYNKAGRSASLGASSRYSRA